MLRPCVDCGTLTSKRRCTPHQRAYEARRGSRRVKGHYDAEWQRLVAQALREHPWCEKCRTPGTQGNPLTGDHRIPYRDGGRNEIDNVAVLCRACNSSKGARPQVDHPPA